MKLQQLANISVCLDFLKSEGVQLVNIDAYDIWEGNFPFYFSLFLFIFLFVCPFCFLPIYKPNPIKPKNQGNLNGILGLISRVIQKYHQKGVAKTYRPAAREKLLAWVQERVKGFGCEVCGCLWLWGIFPLAYYY